MRVKGTTVQKFLLGSALLSALAWNLAQASEIKGLQLSDGATGTRAEIALDASAEFKVLRLSNPNRLVIDLPASRVAGSVRMPAPAGVVRAVRTGQPTPGTARVVFELAEPVAELKPRIEPGADGARLVIEWPGDGSANPPPAIAAAPANAEATQTPASVAASTAITEAAVDPAAASSAATSRLISELVSRGAPAQPTAGVRAVEAPASPAVVRAPTSVPALPPSGVAASGAPTVAKVPPPTTTRIATGVPTRVATGVPTPAAPAASTAPSSAATPASDAAAVKTMREVMRGRGMRPLVIAIDAGHGGQDPGAVGLGGKREKDITLAIARELARQVNATPGLKAYLVRDHDVFIPLNQRARLARQAKADMFVSIHADAAENRNARGSSVYVLSLKGASSQRARWLADKENAADLIGGVRLQQTNNTLASVLLDLTQSGHMRASEDAASHVLQGLAKVGRNHKPQVERANFAVLRTSDMPSMLVETAFISNPDEERRLSDPDHQRALARAVLDGVNTYFVRQPPPGTLYAARAAAEAPVDAGGAGGSP
ncbi:N-acetylmuramoyl-L-alanine amidase [Cognatilysobacter tabacisoli]|uniref:N-acetylmuramoyl-L-alanine amidase n=1 Tax=Cognatilysobacter tabacisoli TaxID=2315424 RepID=UPI000E6B0B1D|nr:N-acetylmuramoyl-L-alanine amidase [Lysobacter tabacisoli]